MNAAPDAHDVGVLTPPSTSGARQGRRRIIYDKPDPCYCKINETTGIVALSLTSFKMLHEKKPLREQLGMLHRLHLQLDAVVLRHQAVKFSGTSESYLVAKCCDSVVEAALAVRSIAEDLLAVNKDIKCVVSMGEVGFAMLGSTGWNYQFFGELVSDLKIKAEELPPGELKVMPCLVEIFQSAEITDDAESGSNLITELRRMTSTPAPSDIDPESEDCPFDVWWASRVQYMDLWLLGLTFFFAAYSIRSQVTSATDLSQVPVLPMFLQIQCCIVNVFAALGWMIRRDWFIRQHSWIMSLVWCTQFCSRAVQAWTYFPRSLSFHQVSILRQILAMNGPEKLLLMTAPVKLWISVLLHWIGFVGSLGMVYQNYLAVSGNLSPSQPDIFTIVLLSFFVFFVFPILYSIRVEKEAKKDFSRLRSNNLKTTKKD